MNKSMVSKGQRMFYFVIAFVIMAFSLSMFAWGYMDRDEPEYVTADGWVNTEAVAQEFQPIAQEFQPVPGGAVAAVVNESSQSGDNPSTMGFGAMAAGWVPQANISQQAMWLGWGLGLMIMLVLTVLLTARRLKSRNAKMPTQPQ